MTFEEELRNLINRYSKENESNTPDMILRDFVCNSLRAFDEAVRSRDKWYGISPEPGK